jgi:hypothetical protein
MGLRCLFGHDWDGRVCRRCNTARAGNLATEAETEMTLTAEVATTIKNCLVDPRDIKTITLLTTEDEAPIRGFQTQESLAVSLWASLNKNCYEVLRGLPQPQLTVFVGPGSGPEARAALSAELAGGIIERSQNDQVKLVVFIQDGVVPQYPPGRSGPRHFHLVTMCRCAEAKKHQIRTLGKDVSIIPSHDAAGRQVVEFRLTNEQKNR